VPELAIAMLACARIGAVHSVIFGGFAARQSSTGERFGVHCAADAGRELPARRRGAAEGHRG